ncbi:MAG: hypothetical protein NVS3B7_04310 [Candidatus Elarobacter sp.]
MTTDDRIPDLSRDEIDRYPVGVITLDRAGTILHYNRAEAAFSRLAPHQVIGRRFFGDVAPCAAVREFQGRFETFAASLDDGAERFDFVFDFAWGKQFVSITMLRRARRDEIQLLVKLRSTARRTGSGAVRAQDRTAASPLDPPARGPGSSGRTLLGQWLEHTDGTTWWSTEIGELFGLDGSAVPHHGALRAYVHPDDRASADEVLRSSAAALKPATLAYRIVGADGTERDVIEHVATLPAVDGVRRVGTILDVSERQHTERRLWQSAHHDPLTGMPNRALLLDRLQSALHGGEPIALLFLDLDRFKHVNDSAGHAVGDALLQLVASRLASCIGKDDTAARLNGDEFVILLRDGRDPAAVEAVAAGVLDALARPYIIDDGQHFVTASIGIAISPHDAATADELLRAADLAMYHSKEQGANAYLRYDERIRRLASADALLEGELQRAVDNGDFVVQFQPIVDARTERIVKAEVLVRWRHRDHGIVPPDNFIPLAERNGLIVPIGAWVLDEACATMRAWDDAGLPPITIAVNISPLQFKDRRFPATVRDTIARHRIDPERLELELTESLAERFEDTLESLLDLKLLGVRLSIDDFGTGYSALAYLKYFPVDTLKLDRAFVLGIGSHPLDGAIAATIVRLADDLHLICVAEGVETAVQRDALRAIGAHQLQGYFFSRPLDAAAFEKRLAAQVASPDPP